MRIRHHLLASAGLVGLLSAAAVAAPPGGGGRPGGMPSQSHPAAPSMPAGRPATAPSPLGGATSAPDTDRGRSEGKGRTDTATAGTRTTGAVVSFSGTTLTLKLPNGTTKTFTVSANAGGQLRPGTPVVVTTNPSGGVLAIVPANQSITGTVVGVTKTAVTLMLPNGRTQTVNVASQAAAHMNLAPGSAVTLTSNNGGMTATKIFVHPSPRPAPTR